MKYIYEFIGTFFLVFTVGMTVLDPNSAGILAPLAIGTVLGVMVFAGGHVSGAHYNPAVSLALYLRRKLSLKDLGAYWVVQVAAGIVAGYVTLFCKGHPPQAPITLEFLKPFLVEFLFTFALCFVVLNVAASKANKGNSFYGWAIGFTVVAGAYAVGPISGGAFNPAVVFGVSIMKLSAWSNLWIFLLANFLASICAALVFKPVEAKH